MQSREERTEQIGTKQCTTTEHLGTVLCHLECKIASKTLKKGGGGGGGGGKEHRQHYVCMFAGGRLCTVFKHTSSNARYPLCSRVSTRRTLRGV